MDRLRQFPEVSNIINFVYYTLALIVYTKVAFGDFDVGKDSMVCVV